MAYIRSILLNEIFTGRYFNTDERELPCTIIKILPRVPNSEGPLKA